MSTITLSAEQWAQIQKRLSDLEESNARLSIMCHSELAVEISALAKELEDLKASKTKRAPAKPKSTAAAEAPKEPAVSDDSDVEKKPDTPTLADAAAPAVVDAPASAASPAAVDAPASAATTPSPKRMNVMEYFRANYFELYEADALKNETVAAFIKSLVVKKNKEEEKRTKPFHIWKFLRSNETAYSWLLDRVQADYEAAYPSASTKAKKPAASRTTAAAKKPAATVAADPVVEIAPVAAASTVEKKDVEDILDYEPEC